MIGKYVNNPWVVCAAFVSGLWWLIQNKPLLPDEIEPNTVYEANVSRAEMQAYVDEKYNPVQTDLNALSADMTDRNIPWALNKLLDNQRGIDSGYTDEQIYNYLCGTMSREGQFRRYQRIHGTKHYREGDYCE